MKNDLIINPEKKKKSPLLIAILTLVIGCMLLTGELDVVKITCIIFGAIALVIGLFNVFSKQLTKKEGNISLGVYCIVIAALLFILAGTISTTLKIIIGIWLILNGLSKLALSFKVKEKFVPLLVLSILLIGFGMYCILVTNIINVITGAFLIASATIDLYNYFFN